MPQSKDHKHDSTGSKNLKRFIKTCQEILVAAAQDLAILTKNGVRAAEIVALAHTCEDLEKLIEGEKNSWKVRLKMKQLHWKLMRGMKRIHRIVKKNPNPTLKRDVYNQLSRHIEPNFYIDSNPYTESNLSLENG